MVATTNALVAFVVDRCTDLEKPTMKAESAFIVATDAMRLPPLTEALQSIKKCFPQTVEISDHPVFELDQGSPMWNLILCIGFGFLMISCGGNRQGTQPAKTEPAKATRPFVSFSQKSK